MEPEAIIVHEHEDMVLADQAYDHIQNIVLGHAQDAYRESAEYIVGKFFGNSIDNVRKMAPIRDGSFNILCSKFIGKGRKSPSKSWLYNALGLYVDEYDLSSFQTYGNARLSVSHKVLLLTISNVEEKKKLAQEAVDNKYSVRKLKERIARNSRKTLAGKKRLSRRPSASTQLRKTKRYLNSQLDLFQDLIESEPDTKAGRKKVQKFKETEKELTKFVNRVDKLIEGLL